MRRSSLSRTSLARAMTLARLTLGVASLGACSASGSDESPGSGAAGSATAGDGGEGSGATAGDGGASGGSAGGASGGSAGGASGGSAGGASGGSAGTGQSGAGGNGGAPITCASLEAARDAELASVQRCTSEAQCGQVITGSSCGCTRDLVARADADVTELTRIMGQLQDLECGLGGGICDCPAADGFACTDGRCAWNYVVAGTCQPTAGAQLCVRGAPTQSGEELQVGSALEVQIMPEGCWSSSCTTVDVATCGVSGSGTNLTATSTFCLGGTGAIGCTPDCSGGGWATCGGAVTLESGDYTLTMGGLNVSFTVPSTLPFGGACDGSPF